VVSRRAFTPWDALVVAALLGLNLIAWAPGRPGRPTGYRITSQAGSRTVPPGSGRIEVPGPLGTTVIEVGKRSAWIVEGPCPLRLCVRTGALARPGRVAVCLPNRVALEALGPEGEVDAVGR